MGTGITPAWELGRVVASPRRIILLNGPPGSGKDTIGKLLAEEIKGNLKSFKTRLIDIALLVSGLSREVWDLRYDCRSLKETPWDKLGGLSQREYLIRISEEWVKPTHGTGYFGRAAGESCLPRWDYRGDFIFTDSGFPDEVFPFLKLSFDVCVFRLHREGYNFDGDSRDYLPDTKRTKSWDIKLVDGKPELAVAEISEALSYK